MDFELCTHTQMFVYTHHIPTYACLPTRITRMGMKNIQRKLTTMTDNTQVSFN